MKILTRITLSIFLISAVFTACKKDTVLVTRKPPVVNAGPAQTITLPIDSITLSGSVVDSGSKVVGYFWSEVSGPNVPLLTAEGSISTKVKALTAGTYIFQLMATDTFGLTGVDTVQIIVNPQVREPITLTLSPSNNPYEFQYVGNASVDYSSGQTTKELGAEAWTENGYTVSVRSAFRFDLSGVSTASVKSAKLTLYSNPTPFTANLTTPNFGTANAMYIQRVNTSWDPATTTWLTQPTTDTTGQVLIPQTNASTLDLVDVDVTGLVNRMVSSGNYGFMIRLQNEVIYNSRIFCSSKYSDSTLHPRLVVTY
ncbi:MAG TPA: DNRLRE domain-containing protein [Puia sp.]|jgi:hypothetical protein|nr:DNRLRE domain-containing protein [Puia sp.]